MPFGGEKTPKSAHPLVFGVWEGGRTGQGVGVGVWVREEDQGVGVTGMGGDDDCDDQTFKWRVDTRARS